MISAPEEVFAGIQRFLGLPVQRLHTRLARQRQRTIPDVVANYDELVDYFAQTEYAGLFEAPSIN